MKNWEDKMEDKFERGAENLVSKPRTTIAKTFIWILSIVVILTLITFVFRAVMAPVAGAVKVIEKTYDGDKMFADYEWFYNQNESYTSIKRQIDIAKKAVEQFKLDAGDRKDWTFEDKNESSRLSSVVTGIEFQLQDVIKAYNAKSKMWTRNQFKGSDLPFTLPLY